MSGKNRSQNRKGNLSQYGLFDIPTNFNMGNSMENDDDNDSDLEEELLALANSSPTAPKRKPAPRAHPQMNVNLDAMVNESMRDIPSDEDISADEDDPELLGELSELTAEDQPEELQSEPPPASTSSSSSADVVKLLENRIKMYEFAEKNAKEAGENGRARRFTRGVKTLKDLLKQAKAGKTIKDDDIPPEVFTGSKQKETANDSVLSPTRPAPTLPVVNNTSSPDEMPSSDPVPESVPETKPVDSASLALLNKRRDEYKVAAVMAKKSGDKETAINYLKITKQFEAVIKAIESGQTVDVSDVPGPPPTQAPTEQSPVEAETQKSEEPEKLAEIPPVSAEVSLITPNSVAEALEQRLEVYKKQEEVAKEQGNSGKVRRMGRIVKQYEQAIKLNKAGKAIPFDELPTPPGFGPIPTSQSETKSPPSEPEPSPSTEQPESTKKPPVRQNTIRVSGNHIPNSRSEKQIALLLAKQKELKIAALKAKQNGEIEQAKEYLRNAKRIDPLIDAASGGLPIDMSSLPISPSAKVQLDAEYDVVMAEECTEDDSSDMDLIGRLESQLTKQLKMCLSTRDHHKALGDVAGTNRFERLALSVTKDLDYVRLIHRTGGAIPKFHYEKKDFSIVKSFTELGDNDLELSIFRGINYNCSNPSEIDTYVKCELPFPQDDPWHDRTSTVKNTNNPEYSATFVIPIQRSSRTCLRVFKRHGIKFEIYSRGGLFRSDPLLGTFTVKLQPLETQCELHDSFDIMDGRKKTGGKLEIRLRVRHPMLTQQVQRLSEKWLIIDDE